MTREEKVKLLKEKITKEIKETIAMIFKSEEDRSTVYNLGPSGLACSKVLFALQALNDWVQNDITFMDYWEVNLLDGSYIYKLDDHTLDTCLLESCNFTQSYLSRVVYESNSIYVLGATLSDSHVREFFTIIEQILYDAELEKQKKENT